jgi:hypothetical protein
MLQARDRGEAHAFTLRDIAEATGLSLAACSRMNRRNVHAIGAVLCSIACSRWSKPGTEPQRRTSLAVDQLGGSGERGE